MLLNPLQAVGSTTKLYWKTTKAITNSTQLVGKPKTLAYIYTRHVGKPETIGFPTNVLQVAPKTLEAIGEALKQADNAYFDGFGHF